MAIERLPEGLVRLVTPQQARDYAHANGWQRVPDVNGGIALFTRPESDVEQLIVPMDPSFDDYGRRMAEVVQNLAGLEKRPAVEVLNDLLMPDADIIRYQISSPEADKGSVPLHEGIRILEGAKRTLLAAACSAIAPAPYHPRMSRTEAVQLLEACRLGQTERGSFTVKIACPLRAGEQGQMLLEGAEPFTRKTTKLLMRSVHRLVDAIKRDQVPKVYEPDAHEPVLSANLCDAILQMQPPAEGSTLTLSATWASVLPQKEEAQVPNRVRIEYDCFPVIEDVYKKLRPSKEPTKSLFVGFVDALNGEPDEDGRMQGEITLLILRDDEGGVVKARAMLNPKDYDTAIDAHRSVGFVKFQGVLHRGRRIHRIQEVADFQRITD